MKQNADELRLKPENSVEIKEQNQLMKQKVDDRRSKD